MGDILIFEEDIVYRKKLIEIALEINPTFDFFETSSADEAYNYSLDNAIIVFIIEVQTNNCVGIDLAKRLRNIKNYQFTPIIVITWMPMITLEVLRYMPWSEYIFKAYSDKEVKAMLEPIMYNCISEQNEIIEPKLALKSSNYTQLMDMNEVIYVEYLNRKIVLTTINETIEHKHMAMKNFITYLDERFIQIHQSIVVNLNYIEKVDYRLKKIKLINIKNEVPIGRSYINDIRGKINDIY